MQAGLVMENPVVAKSEPPRRSNSVEAFDALLVMAQSTQVAALTASFSDATGLEARGDAGDGSARHERVTQETAEARQAEVQAQTARRAEATADSGGKGGERYDRGLVGKNATSSPPPAGGADSKNIGAEPRPFDSQTLKQPAPDLQPASPETTRDASSGSNKALAAEASPHKSDASPAPAERSSTVAPVATTGAAEAKPAVDADRAAASAARTVGRLLAVRGAVESVKAPVEPPVAGTSRNGSTAERPKQAAPEAAGRGSETAEKKPTESADQTRRTAFERLVQQVRLNRGMRVSSATIRLDPPALGKMRIDVRMVDDVMRIRVAADSPHTRELLASRVDELTAALREHNVVVEKVEIVGPGEHEPSAPSEGETDRGARAEDGQGTADAGGNGSEEAEAEVEESAGEVNVTEAPTYAVTDARLDVRI
jgi:flagellar hook-length control protein FliK